MLYYIGIDPKNGVQAKFRHLQNPPLDRPYPIKWSKMHWYNNTLPLSNSKKTKIIHKLCS